MNVAGNLVFKRIRRAIGIVIFLNNDIAAQLFGVTPGKRGAVTDIGICLRIIGQINSGGHTEVVITVKQFRTILEPEVNSLLGGQTTPEIIG